jgi:hypothetical protein
VASGEHDIAHVVPLACAGVAQSVHVVPGRLHQREVLVARNHARVRARESELPGRRLRDDEQVRGAVTARRFGTGERCAGHQTAEGGHRYCQMTSTREVDTEPFPAQGRRLRELGMYRQLAKKQKSRRELA